MSNNTLQAGAIYRVNNPTNLTETKLSFLKKAIEDYNIISDMGVGKFHIDTIYDYIERKLEWCCRGNDVNTSEYGQPAWKHVVRLSMQQLKRNGVIDNDNAERGYWNIIK